VVGSAQRAEAQGSMRVPMSCVAWQFQQCWMAMAWVHILGGMTWWERRFCLVCLSESPTSVEALLDEHVALESRMDFLGSAGG